MYALAARYAPEAIRTGIPVSAKLLCELVRHEIKHGRFRMKQRGISLSKWRGYTINNSLTASIARHIVARRPEWDGLFEFREEWAGKVRNRKQRVIVVPPSV